MKCSGGGNNIVLTNILEIASHTISKQWTTYALTDNIDNYKYLWASMWPITNNELWSTKIDGSNADGCAHAGYMFCSVNYFKNNNIKMFFTSGASGSMAAQYTEIKFSSTTQVQCYKTTALGRTIYIYGVSIK